MLEGMPHDCLVQSSAQSWDDFDADFSGYCLVGFTISVFPAATSAHEGSLSLTSLHFPRRYL